MTKTQEVTKKKVTKKKAAAMKKKVTKKKVAATKAAPKRKKNYLNNKDLLAQVILSKEQEKMTDELAKMLTLLTARYGKKGNVANYTYNEDMQAYAMMMLVRTWSGFNPERSNNPFAYFTQCIKNSFIQYLKSEKRQRVIRDEILVDKGLTPSYNYQIEYENRRIAHDEEDHDHHMEDANSLEEQQKTGDDVLGYK